jgi:reactive intermediate/imine deaminase
MSSSKQSVLTPSAPQPFGAYSQAIKAGNTVYLAGQIPYNVNTGQVVLTSIEEQAEQTFSNIKAVAEAAGGTIDDIAKLTIFITDFKYFSAVNSVMEKFFKKPYPARSTVGVASLGKGADIEVEGIMHLPDKNQSKI